MRWAKQRVKEFLNSREDPATQEKVLVFMSDQLVTLDETPGREWQVSELRTKVDGDRADIEAFLDIPMRAANARTQNCQLCHREKSTPPHSPCLRG